MPPKRLAARGCERVPRLRRDGAKRNLCGGIRLNGDKAQGTGMINQ